MPKTPGRIVRRGRRLLLEQLEQRWPLAGWQNAFDRLDVNDDGMVAPVDVLILINRQNAEGSGPLTGQAVKNDPLVDVNGNNQFEPNDVLIVVNALNQTGPLPPRKVNLALTTDAGVQQMPSVAVDPNDADNVVVAYMDYSLVDTGYAGLGVAVSRNGGTSWTRNQLPVPAGFDQGAANPIAKFDDQGRVFVSYMAATFLGDMKPGLTNPAFGLDRIPGFQSNNGVFVARSDDGGLSWHEPAAVVSHAYDGETPVPFDLNPDIAIDLHPTLSDGEENVNYGQLYATWSRIYPPGQFPGYSDALGGIEIRFAVSRDRGLTWETQASNETTKVALDANVDPGPGTAAGEGFVDFSHPVVGADGEIYISFWAGANFGFNVSHDGGQSFLSPDFQTGNQIVFGTGFTSGMNRTGLPGSRFRTVERRSTATDFTTPGLVYAVEPIQVFGGLGELVDPAEVHFGRSSDYAQSWKTTISVGALPDVDDLTCDEGMGFDCLDQDRGVPVNDDNGARTATEASPPEVISGQVMSQIATSESGEVALIWYDTRRDPQGIKLDVFGTISTDHGQTFVPNFRITDKSFDANQGAFANANGAQDYYLGDAIGLAASNGFFSAAWTDTRSSNQDIVFAKFSGVSPPGPLNDRFEPNDTPKRDASPTIIGPVIQRFLPRLVVDDGDEDWFAVEASAVGDIIVDLQFDDSANASADSLVLELWESTGTALLTTADDIINGDGSVIGERLRFPAIAGQEFLVRVFGAGGAAVGYSLRFESLTDDLGHRVHAVVGESLDIEQKALYKVVAGASGSVEIAVTAGNDVQGTLGFQVLSQDTLMVLGSSAPIGAGETEALTLQSSQGQAFLLLVETGSDAMGTFSLDFTNLDLFTTLGIRALSFPAPSGPSQASVADIDADGNLDVVVVSALSDTISVLLGTGDGLLQSPRQTAIGAHTKITTDITGLLPTFGRAVEIGDVDGDSILDIVATNSGSADVSVLLGHGDGTAQPQRRFEATPAPFDLEMGDVNGDGLLDVVVIETAIKSQVIISTLINRGDGTFEPQRTSPLLVAGNNGTIRLGDFDEDGVLDVVASGDGGPAELAVLLGNGDGTFAAQTNFPSARRAVALAVSDIDEDGHLDIVTAGLSENRELNILLGNGDGTFAPPFRYENGVSATGIQIVDYASQVTLSDGTTMLGPPDGRNDIVLTNSGASLENPVPAEIVVRPGLGFDAEGSLLLGDPQRLARGEAPLDLDVGDIDNDGNLDLVVVDRRSILVIYGRPPQFTPNDTLATARDLGTVVHLFDQTQTIVPDRQNAFYKFTVPTEAVTAADEVIDVSLLFQYTEGDGIGAELRDAQGNVLGSGDRFRILAAQGEELTLHVFGINGGSGAFTPIINVLPQVVSIEAQALLPGVGLNPGGPTTSIVVTLQGDRLDPESAQDPANFSVTSFGPDRLFGTADDRVIEIQEIVYSPGTNVSISSGRTFPTAVRQTITLATDEPLPTGSYRVDLSANIRTEDFNEQEAGQLADTAELVGHPIVSLESGQIVAGSRQVATGLVLPATSVGDLGVFTMGTGFLTQLHADLAAQLDATLSDVGDDAQVTDKLLALLTERLVPTVGPSGQRITSIIAIWLDPVDLLFDIYDQQIVYEQAAGTVTNNTDQCFVEVGGNIEVIICPLVNPVDEMVTLDVSLVSGVSRGGALQITTDEVLISSLTDPMRSGQTRFEFQY